MFSFDPKHIWTKPRYPVGISQARYLGWWECLGYEKSILWRFKPTVDSKFIWPCFLMPCYWIPFWLSWVRSFEYYWIILWTCTRLVYLNFLGSKAVRICLEICQEEWQLTALISKKKNMNVTDDGAPKKVEVKLRCKITKIFWFLLKFSDNSMIFQIFRFAWSFRGLKDFPGRGHLVLYFPFTLLNEKLKLVCFIC